MASGDAVSGAFVDWKEIVSSLATELSRERVRFLFQSRWPADVNEVEAWLRSAPGGRQIDSAPGSPITPVTFDTHEGHVAGFSWFAGYSDSAQLVQAHDDLGRLITTLLGVPGIRENKPDPYDYWVTPDFSVDTYAHDVSEREPVRDLKPTLQVYVADTQLATAKEAFARQPGRHRLLSDPNMSDASSGSPATLGDA